MKITSLQTLEDQTLENVERTSSIIELTKKSSIDKLMLEINANQDVDTDAELEKQDKIAKQIFKKKKKGALIKKDRVVWDSANDHCIKSSQ